MMPSIDTINEERREWYEERELEELASYYRPEEDGGAQEASCSLFESASPASSFSAYQLPLFSYRETMRKFDR